LNPREMRGSGGLLGEELRGFYYSDNIVRVIKPTKLRRAGHVARME
jgi:hypothetical protein